MHIYCLIGFPLGHSFSKGYFTEKFEKMGLSDTHVYEKFELENINDFPTLLKTQSPNLRGLNVTIPHKQNVIPFLDSVDEAALKIGAVNTIKIMEDGSTKGFNTDYWGFRWTLEQWADFQEIKPKKSLVLGKGGAAKAIIQALQDLGLETQYVSRKKEEDTLTYDELTGKVMQEHLFIVNTTPLGMFPKVDSFPEIPYNLLTDKHLLYDIVYNPLETMFLKKGLEHGAKGVHFGLEMLHGQAEKAWEIWSHTVNGSR
jgi:shikimate dehydrogenase